MTESINISKQIKAIKQEIKILKTKCTKFGNFLKNPNDQLSVRFEQFKPLLNEYYRQISRLATLEDDQQPDIEEDDEFESHYYAIYTEAEKLSKSANSISYQSSGNSEAISVKLPTINLPTFEGNYTNWSNFKNSFASLIHENIQLSAIQKFHYLKSSVTDEAASVIAHLAIAKENYTTAWELLNKRYDNKRVIVQKHLNNLLNLPTIMKNSSASLRNLMDIVQSNLNSVKNLGINVDTWDLIIIQLIVNKLDFNTKKEWEHSLKTTELPNLHDLMNVLNHQCQTLEALSANNNQLDKCDSKQFTYKGKVQAKFKNFHINSKPTDNKICLGCNSNKHLIYQCQQFLNKSIGERKEHISLSKLCYNCLKPNHSVSNCKAGGCKLCGKRHNTLIHSEKNSEDQLVNNIENDDSVANLHIASKRKILLSTVLVRVEDCHGKSHQLRAVLDTASQENFITTNAFNKLKLNSTKVNYKVIGLQNTSIGTITKKSEITIYSNHSNYSCNVSCMIIDKITGHIPENSINISQLKIPNYIKNHLADPDFYNSGEIDLLIGAEFCLDILLSNKYKCGKTQPTFRNSHLGWIAGGPYISTQSGNKNSSVPLLCHLTNLQELDNKLSKFWELEEIQGHRLLSKEEKACEELFVETHSRSTDGRFIVYLPFKNEISQISSTYNIALNRLQSLERKFKSNPQFKLEYSKFLEEYKSLGHMELTENNSHSGIFLPHQGVIKESSLTTKIRVVFDASARSANGDCLNNHLYIGPNLQKDLVSLLIRFRSHPFVLAADIKQMYRQIWVTPEHQKFQQILWRNHESNQVDTYKLKTVTYGTACAPYLAMRCLNELAYQAREIYPKTSEIILNDFYMDDLLTGFNSIDEGIKLRNELISTLKGGGFELHKWAANHDSLLPNSNSSNASVIKLNDDTTIKTLGLIWNCKNDSFQYEIKPPKQVATFSKRYVLSTIASIYDPLGLLGPVMVTAKLILQQLWQLQLDWDETLPSNLNNNFELFLSSLFYIDKLKIPRQLSTFKQSKLIELHGFCDASERAYGACVYLKSSNEHDQIQISLVSAKSKVAPLKKSTIPRLELCGALLLVRLMQKVIESLRIPNITSCYWCDSTIVLSWIDTPSHLLKTFVGNRIAEIQTDTSASQWHHVKSKDNPADLISRGITADELLESSLWWSGPRWLYQPLDLRSRLKNQISEIPELRTSQCTSCFLSTEISYNPFISLIERHSCLYKLQRVVSYIIRFSKTRVKHSESISVEELNYSLNILIKITQNYVYSREISHLKNGKEIHKSSHLLTLHPFLDNDGLLRVGGRLTASSSIPFDQKHPIILPKGHLTTLIVRTEHLKHLHVGATTLLAMLRLKYWPISGLSTVKKVLQKCIVCVRSRKKPCAALMGNLPSYRITPVRPFTICGIDYAGPFNIKQGNLRKPKLTKAYLCLFICFALKVVHLELVSELSTDAFLNAFRRFTSRRGLCKEIITDNGTNFIGANNRLADLSTFLKSEQKQLTQLTEKEFSIAWKFIPPRSPHFGGLWESAIKSFKSIFYKKFSDALLTYEEFNTVIIQIEGIMNSRPLTPISHDPNDLNPLTPAHFLIGDSLKAVPSLDLSNQNINRLDRFQYVQHLYQQFWNRWHIEYLTILQRRAKWKTVTQNLKPGDLVVVIESTPPASWRMGRVLECFPGKDGIVRVVTIKTISGIQKRAVSKLVLLPIS